MIKNKLLTSTAIVSLFIATNAFSQKNNFTGPSIALTGSAVGGTSKNSWNTEYFDEIGFFFGGIPTSNTPGKINIIPGADIGYGFGISNNFVMGIGASYDFSKTKIGGLNFLTGGLGEDLADIKLDNELKDHYSIYLQPTYLLNKDSAIFAKVGRHFAKARWNTRADIYDVAIVGEDVFTNYLGTVSDSETKNIAGWGYGIGLKTFLTSNLFFQAEAGVVNYKKWSLDSGIDDGITFKPKTANGTISIGYKF